MQTVLASVTSAADGETIHVLDNTETVTSKLQDVTVNTEAAVTQVESLLYVVRSSSITLWDGHLRKRHSVEDLSALEPTIVDGEALSDGSGDTELPGQPLDLGALSSK